MCAVHYLLPLTHLLTGLHAGLQPAPGQEVSTAVSPLLSMQPHPQLGQPSLAPGQMLAGVHLGKPPLSSGQQLLGGQQGLATQVPGASYQLGGQHRQQLGQHQIGEKDLIGQGSWAGASGGQRRVGDQVELQQPGEQLGLQLSGSQLGQKYNGLLSLPAPYNFLGMQPVAHGLEDLMPSERPSAERPSTESWDAGRYPPMWGALDVQPLSAGMGPLSLAPAPTPPFLFPRNSMVVQGQAGEGRAGCHLPDAAGPLLSFFSAPTFGPVTTGLPTPLLSLPTHLGNQVCRPEIGLQGMKPELLSPGLAQPQQQLGVEGEGNEAQDPMPGFQGNMQHMWD